MAEAPRSVGELKRTTGLEQQASGGTPLLLQWPTWFNQILTPVPPNPPAGSHLAIADDDEDLEGLDEEEKRKVIR